MLRVLAKKVLDRKHKKNYGVSIPRGVLLHKKFEDAPHHEEIVMRKFDAARLLGSPVTLVCLLLATSAFTFGWLRANAAGRPPAVPNFSWNEHPNALLVAFPTNDCGCGLSPVEWVSTGISHHLHVLLVASQPLPAFATLKSAGFPARDVSIVTNADPDLVRRFSSGDKAGAARIRDGRMVFQVQGGVPPESFFR